jgi:heme/copper-type cytochrome/quinol oxidase subunit 3
MLLVVATEATLFAVLVASYFYLRFQHQGSWPPDGIADPKLLLPTIMTVLLVASSVGIYLSERAIRRGDQGRLRLGMAITFLLGLAFLVLQGVEYHEHLAEIRPSTDAYSSLFFTITGFHGAHVVIGLLLLLWTQVFAWRGAYRAENHVAVQVVALFWQFIPIVWVVIYASLYLSPRL